VHTFGAMRLRLFAVLFGGIVASACASEAASDASRSDDVSTVKDTRPKEQTIGNCWIYATLGWVESMELAHSGTSLDLSESYLTYLHAFTRITTDEFVFDVRGDWNTGDFFGEGAELVARYGLMDQSAFVSAEKDVDRSTRQEAANAVIIAALKTGGELSTKEARRDPRKVRAVLDRAWALPSEISETMTRTFGPDLSKTRAKGATLPAKGFHDPAKMIVAKAKDGHEITLDEAMGELDPMRETSSVRDRKERRGPYAWQRVEMEDAGARDGAVLRLKKTLNAGYSVPIDWYPAWDSMREGDGSFHAPVRGEGGWHASLVSDYEIDVPGHGVLPAGTPVTDPALLEKTLAKDAEVKFLRLKNSWGREIGPLAARGYTDAMWDYLTWEWERPRIDYDEKKETGIGVAAFVLPPPSWEGATH
jgi:hypothetical protein